jgi:predicted DNA-binding transcriptional regulator YafY
MTGWRKRQIGEHMTKDEALRLALEALEMYELETNSEFQRKAITAIKEALAHPPQRTWVDLTDEEISDIAINNPPSVHEFARAIEAKLKEKNT